MRWSERRPPCVHAKSNYHASRVIQAPLRSPSLTLFSLGHVRGAIAVTLQIESEAEAYGRLLCSKDEE